MKREDYRLVCGPKQRGEGKYDWCQKGRSSKTTPLDSIGVKEKLLRLQKTWANAESL